MHYHRGLIFGNFNVHQPLVRFIDSLGKAPRGFGNGAFCLNYKGEFDVLTEAS